MGRDRVVSVGFEGDKPATMKARMLNFIYPYTAPPSTKGKTYVKYSEATYFDIACCLFFGRSGSYGKWVPQSDSKYDKKRAKDFIDNYKGQFHGFRGGPMQYGHYVSHKCTVQEPPLPVDLFATLCISCGFDPLSLFLSPPPPRPYLLR